MTVIIMLMFDVNDDGGDYLRLEKPFFLFGFALFCFLKVLSCL